MKSFLCTGNRSWRLARGVLASVLIFSGAVTALPEPTASNPGVPWPATDALGRSLPLSNKVGSPRADRFVGIFYFLTHDDPMDSGPHDVSKILQQDPDALSKPELWGHVGESYYWGEPLYGYYRGSDPWVLRRHAQLLADAGVDVIIFDTTNARTYPEVYLALCRVFQEVRQAGGRTPQIAFMVNTDARATAAKIYHKLYQPGLYHELWFYWHGKPLMICDPKEASPELKHFFTLRAAHWPFTLTNTPYAWHWEATSPQPYGYTDNPNQPEEVNVSVAQNLRQSDGKVTNMSDGDARGRSFHDGTEDTTLGAVNHGYNFAEQWQRAYQLQPPFVFVTGWNEWTAGRWSRPGKPVVFVDQYDKEFSRDIEMMRGGFGDDYYYQLVAGIRRFKGVPPLPAASAPKTINIAGSIRQWRDVQPEFRENYVEDTLPRDYAGNGGLHYTNYTGRNDFVMFKVARDTNNVYFYARTREAITPSRGKNWMWLFIDADQSAATGWKGYDYIVNRTVAGRDETWLEKNIGGWTWKKVALLKFHVRGKELMLAIPRADLGLASGNSPVRIDFKWADNLQHPGDVMDFYKSGDVAPEGRFRYRYIAPARP
jgi:hypothetical protein